MRDGGWGYVSVKMLGLGCSLLFFVAFNGQGRDGIFCFDYSSVSGGFDRRQYLCDWCTWTESPHQPCQPITTVLSLSVLNFASDIFDPQQWGEEEIIAI